MKVGAKLGVGFLVVVLLIWATVFFAANTYTGIHEEFDLLKEDIVPGTIAMGDMENAANEAAHELMDYVVFGEEESKQIVLSATKDLEEAGLEHLEHETHIGQEEQKVAEELLVKINVFKSAVAELIDMKEQGVSVDEILERENETIHPSLDGLIEQLEEHKAAYIQELVAAEEAVHEAYTSGVQVLFLAAGLITLLAVVVAWFTARLIVKPLRALHRGTEIIGQGNLDYKVGTKAKDEIGQLSRAFDQMTEDLRRTTTSIDELNKEITERKRMEEELRKSEEKWRSLTGNTDDTIVITDNNDVIQYINKTIPPTTPEGVIGKTVYEYVLEEHHNVMRESLKKVYKTGEPDSYEVTLDMSKIDPKIGTLWFNTKVVPIKTDKELSGVIMIATDITERKRAEEEREALLKDLEIINRRLEESNRELQDFVYVTSHDLREPLRKITSFGMLLQDLLGGKLDEDQQENFDFMIDGSKRMQTMIDDLLTYSRVTTKAKLFQQVNLNNVIEDLRNLELAVLLDETKGTIYVPEMLPPVHGDSSQIHQLLQNLVANGLKFHREDVLPEITIRAHRIENNMVRVEVQDNGIGIGKEYHEQVFTMFKRLHSRMQYQGTGIGLAVCRKIVNRHGGEIGLESTPGEGSVFWFTLPRGSY